MESRQPWVNGDGPAVKPLAKQIGFNPCFESGDSIHNAIDTDGMRDGFLVQCFAPLPVDDSLWEIASSFDICAMQYFYATVLFWSYEGEFNRVESAFRQLLGPGIVVTSFAGAGPYPNVHVVQLPTFVIVVSTGTPNNQTLAMQAFSLIIPPTDMGIFSTYPLWYNVGQYIHVILTTLGVTKDQKIMFAGHSMGGSAIDTLAARYKYANIDRVVRMITFGSPRVGDDRLNTLLRKCPNVSVANEEDIVCSVPPDQLTIYPVAVAFSMPSLFVWEQWIKEPNRARMAIDGSITFNVDPIIDTPLLTHLLTQILALQPFDIVLPHFIEEYRRRIDRRCPDETWPISEALWAYLHGDDFRVDAGLRIGALVADPPPIEFFNPGLAIGAVIGDPPGVPCPCCPDVLSPESFSITTFSAEIPFLSGLSIDLEFFEPDPDSCAWIATVDDVSGGTLDIAVTSSVVYGVHHLVWSMTWTDGAENWESGGDIFASGFQCDPWAFTGTGPIAHNTVIVPGSFRISTGTMNIVNPGLRIGARLVTVGPLETINAGLLLGSVTGPPRQKPGLLIGAKVV